MIRATVFSHIGNSREVQEDNYLLGEGRFLSPEVREAMGKSRRLVTEERTFSSDGTTITNTGDMSFRSDGSTLTRKGNVAFDSRGVSYVQNGNTTFCSDGSTRHQNGNMDFGL